jgi:hypothetical protein
MSAVSQWGATLPPPPRLSNRSPVLLIHWWRKGAVTRGPKMRQNVGECRPRYAHAAWNVP